MHIPSGQCARLCARLCVTVHSSWHSYIGCNTSNCDWASLSWSFSFITPALTDKFFSLTSALFPGYWPRFLLHPSLHPLSCFRLKAKYLCKSSQNLKSIMHLWHNTDMQSLSESIMHYMITLLVIVNTQYHRYCASAIITMNTDGEVEGEVHDSGSHNRYMYNQNSYHQEPMKKHSVGASNTHTIN